MPSFDLRKVLFYKEAKIFFGLFFFVFPLFVQSKEIDFHSLAQSKIWLNQLQYREDILGNWKSEADAESFFMAKNGRTSPEEELKATYELFLQAPETPWGYTQQPVLCAFPTRLKFLQDNTKVQFKNIPCPEREEWKKPFLGSQPYLVFSDAYPNNPASMFGHTFLLFSKNVQPDSALGMMDYAINFSAQMEEGAEESFLYTFKGIFGGYPGRYRVYTFYQMLNQYTKWDSRDLWYLKIPLNAVQVDRFMDHIWEIFSNTHFDYYFINENCSYRLLAAIDYADPSLNLINEFHNKFPIYYVAPLSTYKTLKERFKNSEEEKYTPSIQKKLKAIIKSLTKENRQRFDFLLAHAEAIKEETNIEVLDALSAYFDYKKSIGSSTYLAQATIDNLQATLRQRAKIQLPSTTEPVVDRPISPLVSHDLSSFRIGTQQVNSKLGLEFGGKVAYHDFLSPSEGYVRWSHLNFIETSIVNFDQKTTLNSLVLADLISFFPIQGYDIKYSWKANGGFKNDFKTYLQGGLGLSWQTPSERQLFYFFVSPTMSTNKDLTDSKALFIETEMGFSAELLSRLKFWITYHSAFKSPDWSFKSESSKTQIKLSYPLGHNNELRLYGEFKKLSDTTSLFWQHNF